MALLWTFLLFASLTYFLVKFSILFWKDQVMKKKTNSIPGPNGLPVFGVAFEFLKKEISFDLFESMSKQFGSIFKLHHGPSYVKIGVSSPEYIKLIFNSEKSFNKPSYYDFLNLKNALFNSSGADWKLHRKFLSSAFNKTMIINSMSTINKTAMRLRKQLAAKVNEPEFDCSHLISFMVVELTFENILGLEVDDKNQEILNQYLEDSTKSVSKIPEKII